MGIEFDRVLDEFDGPFQPVPDVMGVPAGTVRSGPGNPAGFLLSHEVNNAFTAVFSLLSEGNDVYWLTEDFSAGGTVHPKGTFWIPGASGAETRVDGLAQELGLTFWGVTEGPNGAALELSRPRIGLWDRYGGSMPSGWVRFILEEFGMDYQLVFPMELDAGGLADKFDVLIFPDGAIPGTGGSGGRGGRGGGAGPDPESFPPQYRDRLGSVTAETTVPRLREFLEAGGSIVTLENSTTLGYHLGLPVRDHLVDGDGVPFRSEEFFVPGSLLEVGLRGVSPVTHGLNDHFIVNFARSPVFGIDSGAQGVQPLAVYEDEAPLRSGWAWGQEALHNGVAMLEANIGQGTLYLFGPQVTYRGQTHETFPFVFNAILLSAAREMNLR